MSAPLRYSPVVATILLGLNGCASPPPAPAVGQPSFYSALTSADARVDTAAARDMISIYRANNGLAPLVVDAQLQGAALDLAQKMAATGKAGGKAIDLRRTVQVENVSAGYHTLAEAFSGWRQSPRHNANMLNPHVRRIGIATAYAPDSKYKVFWALVLSD